MDMHGYWIYISSNLIIISLYLLGYRPRDTYLLLLVNMFTSAHVFWQNVLTIQGLRIILQLSDRLNHFPNPKNGGIWIVEIGDLSSFSVANWCLMIYFKFTKTHNLIQYKGCKTISQRVKKLLKTKKVIAFQIKNCLKIFKVFQIFAFPFFEILNEQSFLR